MALTDAVADLTAAVADLIATGGRSVTLIKRLVSSYTPAASDSLAAQGGNTITASETSYVTTAFIFDQLEGQPQIAPIERFLKMIFNTAALGVTINQNDRVVFGGKKYEIAKVTGAFPEAVQTVYCRLT